MIVEHGGHVWIFLFILRTVVRNHHSMFNMDCTCLDLYFKDRTLEKKNHSGFFVKEKLDRNPKGCKYGS